MTTHPLCFTASAILEDSVITVDDLWELYVKVLGYPETSYSLSCKMW